MTSAFSGPIHGSQRWLIITCVVAGIIHGANFFLHPATPPSPDEQEYQELSMGLADTGQLRLPSGEVAKRMPLYPALLSVAYRTQKPELWQNAALMMQTFLAWCSTLFIAIIAQQLADARAGWVAGISAALYSPLLYLQMSFLTETLLVFLLSSALLLYLVAGLRTDSTAGQLGALAGVSALFGLATLTRVNALVLLVPFVIDAACRAGSTGRRVARIVVLILPALGCIIPWSIRNERLIGEYTLSTTGGLNFYLGQNADYSANPGLDQADYDIFDRLRTSEGLTEAEADRRLFSMGVEFVKNNPRTVLVNCVRKAGVWYTPSVGSYGPTLGVIALIALVSAGWGRWRRKRMIGLQRAIFLGSIAAVTPMAIYCCLQLRQTILPLTTPLYVLSIGTPALLFLRSKLRVTGLFLGLFATQFLIAIAFIPLSRLRWPIDILLIIAFAVGVSNLARRMDDAASG